MNNTKEINKSTTKGTFLKKLKKILLYTVAGIVGLLVLAALYKVLEFLFIAAVLLIAWLGPRRWWW